MKRIFFLLSFLLLGCAPVASDELQIGDTDYRLDTPNFATVGLLVENLYPVGFARDSCVLVVFAMADDRWSRYFVHSKCGTSQRPTFVFSGYYITKAVTDYAFSHLFYQPVVLKFGEDGWSPTNLPESGR